MTLQSILDAMDEPLKAVPRFYIEPKDKDPASEFERQTAFVKHMRKYCPNCMVMAVPNGSHDSDWSRLRKHAEGLHKGWPDLEIVWNHGTYRPEFKNGLKMPSQAQVDTLNRLHDMGFHVGVYRNGATLLQHLADAGAPVNIRSGL